MKASFWSWIVLRKRKLLLWGFGLLLFYTVMGFLILPPIVRSIAVKQLSKQLDREVSIQQIKINPFALSTTVRGLLIKDKDGEPFLSWDEVYVNFQISSLFTRAWTFKEISTSKPYVRVQMNKDYTFNFSDLITKFSTNAAPAKPVAEGKPLVLHIGRLHIGGAEAAYADFTTREPFKRVLGPLDITLDDFRTDPDNKNPYAFSGTTDAGERIAWSGFFYLSPLRSQGSLTLDKFTLNKYAPLYQDLVRFEVRDGSIGVHLNYRFELSGTNRVMQVKNTALALRNFKLGMPGDTNNVAELMHFAVTGASADLQSHEASVESILVNGGSLFLRRNQDQSVNVLEMAKPAETATNVPGGIVVLLRSVTNAVAMLLQSTNQWRGTVQMVDVTNCDLHLEDLVNSRPARLDLSDIQFDAKNISNLAGTNLTADFSMRWNTNGLVKVQATAALLPPTAEIQMDVDQLNLGTLDPYLEPKLNLYILGSKVGLHGKVNLTTPADGLPQVTFHGDAGLDGFHTVDGDLAEDLLKWDSLSFNGIDANLNPQTVAIKEILVDNLYARLVIETNKSINLLNALRMTNAPATNEVKAVATGGTVTNAPLPPVSVGVIIITNTQLSFTDRSLSPEVNLSIRDVNGSVAGLSTEQLQHAVVDLSAKVDGVGPATITGLINPLNQTATNDIKISLKDMDLTPASPYAGKFAGYRIAQGKLNLDLAYELVGKDLKSKNVITLDRFTFGEKVESPEATHLPVRLAIAILKDRDGKIVLDVPIDGRTDDPKFHVSKVVWGAIGNILEKVATSPFSLLGALVGGGGEELGYQDFAPGSASLTDDGKKKLDTLTKALHERPALGLEISGSVDAASDREGLERMALDSQIRMQVWRKLRKSEQATNSVDQVVLTPDDRAHWILKYYGEAVANGKITPELIAANTNLAVFAAKVAAGKPTNIKAATLLMNFDTKGSGNTNGPTYQSKLVPPPDANEALLLATYPVSEGDLETLAAARAKAVQDYLLLGGQTEASRLFLKASQGGLRAEGSRAYLQFQ
ncbi:MAG TPA: DUF748 domain-containing protein [Candidatus Acidoferrales bacterium]|jgi:hypothetical protein|nr:DUF748 domain-containing protein [Candidatus Acidoferrales bacterium]